MGIELIRWGLPFCGNVEEESECSLITRTAVIGLGGIALVVGIFALSGIPGLNALGTIEGAVLTSTGGFILLMGLCLRSVKENSYENIKCIQFQEKNIESKCPPETLVLFFQNLNIENIPVVANVCIAWYNASKQNALWMFYLHRDFNIHNSIVISNEFEYRNQKLNQVFTQLVRYYMFQGYHYEEGEEIFLHKKWERLVKFTERYPEFKDKLPEKIVPDGETSWFVELDLRFGRLIYGDFFDLPSDFSNW